MSAAAGETAVYAVLDDGAIEIAFPDAEASWEEEKRSWSDPSGRGINAEYNLRWRLPP